jgi:deoxyribose-phosphate aldolase
VTVSPDLDLVLRCLDLTALRGDETPDEIRALCRRAAEPGPGCPPVAAVVVYARMVSIAVDELAGTNVKVAAVAGGFPTGIAPVEERLAEIAAAVDAGAQEIDTVLDRTAIEAGHEGRAFGEIASSKEACAGQRLKVILETGALRTPEGIRQAADLAMRAGADFLKTSTGKMAVGATLEASRVMMEAIRDFRRETGRPVGIKVAGAVRTAQQALSYLELCREVLGPDWMTPDRFRFGASGLLDQLVSG